MTKDKHPVYASDTAALVAQAAVRAKPTLRSSIITGFAWTTLGFVASQMLRLGGNLILTRLLAPEHFGLMAIITVILIGVSMFSDIGLAQAVIRSPHVTDPVFLNTAWSIQLLRGLLLVLICCALAVPLAHFYNEPLLVALLPVAAIPLLITAAAPMQIYTLQRDMKIGRLICIDLVSQVLALVAMALIALKSPSVWVLLIGSVVAVIVKTTTQWLLLTTHKHAFGWDNQHVRDIAGLGLWIFLSTVLAFASNSAGSLVLAKLTTMEKVGLFSIACTLAKAAENFYEQIAGKVLLPVYSTLINGEAPVDQAILAQKVQRIRVRLILLFVPAMCVGALLANQIFALLFDPRYAEGAWMFQALLLGFVPTVMANTTPLLMAQGRTKMIAFVSASKLIGYAIVLTAGYQWQGDDGAILGIASLPVLMYLLDVWLQRKLKVYDYRVDAVAAVFWLPTLAAIALKWI